MATQRGCKRFEWIPQCAAAEVCPLIADGEGGSAESISPELVPHRGQSHSEITVSELHRKSFPPLFFLPLRKGTLESAMPKLPRQRGVVVFLLVNTSCTRATDDVFLLSGWSDVQDDRAAPDLDSRQTRKRPVDFSSKQTQLCLHPPFRVLEALQTRWMHFCQRRFYAFIVSMRVFWTSFLPASSWPVTTTAIREFCSLSSCHWLLLLN